MYITFITYFKRRIEKLLLLYLKNTLTFFLNIIFLYLLIY